MTTIPRGDSRPGFTDRRNVPGIAAQPERDVTQDTWATLVQPAIDALRALPEPDRKRERRTHYDVVVLEQR